MLLKYKCGCIGFKSNSGKDIVVYACNGESNYSFSEANLPITSKKLDCDEEETIIEDLSKLIADGYSLREIKLALR